MNGHPEIAGDTSTSTLSVRIRHDQSLLTRLLQIVIKPLRPRLVAPPKQPWPAGSNRLDAPSGAKKRCNIHERNRQGIFEYELTAKSVKTADGQKAGGDESAKAIAAGARPGQPHHRLYYFAGGGFQSVPSSDHWKFVAELACRLGGANDEGANHSQRGDDADQAKVIRTFVVSMPLAPSSPAADSLRALRAWVEDLLEQALRENFTVTLSGDSSGGNIAATLTLAVSGAWGRSSNDPSSRRVTSPDVNQSPAVPKMTESFGEDDPLWRGRSPNALALKHALLICPAVDMRNTNPAMHDVDRHECILTQPFTTLVARIWTGAQNSTAHSAVQKNADMRTPQLASEDVRVSPVLADLAGLLAGQGTRVDGLIAGYDVLGPDARILVDRLKEEGVRGEWVFWERQMHCWPLTWWGGFPEARQSLAWIVDKVQEVAGPGQSMKQ